MANGIAHVLSTASAIIVAGMGVVAHASEPPIPEASASSHREAGEGQPDPEPAQELDLQQEQFAQGIQDPLEPTPPPPTAGRVAAGGFNDNRQITNEELCGAPYYSSKTITVDLAQYGPVSAGSTLTVGSGETLSCGHNVTEITFIRTGTDGYQNLEIQHRLLRQSGKNTLSRVVFPDSLQTLTIGDEAFEQVSNGSSGNALESVELPQELTTLHIGKEAFYQSTSRGNNALRNIVFPDSLQTLTINSRAFYQYVSDVGGGNNALENAVFPQELTTLHIGKEAFYQRTQQAGGNALKTVSFPAGLETLNIGDYAFFQGSSEGYSSALESVSFPDGLTTLVIGDRAFYQHSGGGNALVGISFPEGLKTLIVGEDAFRQIAKNGESNTLAEISFPDSLETLSLGFQAFYQLSEGGSNALTGVSFPIALSSLDIGGRAFQQHSEGGGSNALTNVSFPEGLETLTIRSQAFDQRADGGGNNALTNVSFPEGLETLTIGSGAFSQYSDTGASNTLASISFPAGLKVLSIGGSAFYQHSRGEGNNALTAVSFPDGLETLTIGSQAFRQRGGAGNALVSASFPDGLELLTIDNWAFYLDVSAEDLVLFFPFDGGGLPAQVSLGTNVTSGSDSDGSTWVWLGENGTTTSDKVTGWGTQGSYVLNGPLTVTFDPNGGTVATEEVTVLPAVQGEPRVATPDDVRSSDLTGFTKRPFQYLIDLPTASPATSWQENTSLVGWCTEQWENGTCRSTASEAGSRVKLDAEAGPHRLSAGWSVAPPAPTLVPSAGCEISPTVAIPQSLEGLYAYESRETGESVAVTVMPSAPYVSLTSHAWSFDVSLPTYTLTFDANGGDGVFEDISVKGEGCTISLPANTPTKDGHQFVGWERTVHGQPIGDPHAPQAAVTITADTEMVAKWLPTFSPKPGYPQKPAKPVIHDKSEDQDKSAKPAIHDKLENQDKSASDTTTTPLPNTGSSNRAYAIAALLLTTVGATTLHLKRRNH